MSTLEDKRRRLLALLKSYGSCAVAYSGGVDSAVVAKAAQVALGDRAIAVTGVSASLAEGELHAARQLAHRIGIRHVELCTDELSRSDYTQNAPDRCFHCKTELYTKLAARIAEWGVHVIVNGANLDDLGDYRPGMAAAQEFHVQSPLSECRISKAEVRQLAAGWQLPVADKPAAPCLSSRIAYGEQVTPERLRMIDRAEQAIRRLGIENVRVRYHGGDLARIEVSTDAIPHLATAENRANLSAELKRLGFKFVSLDLDGFRSGSLNDLVLLADRMR